MLLVFTSVKYNKKLNMGNKEDTSQHWTPRKTAKTTEAEVLYLVHEHGEIAFLVHSVGS